jgi:hypothetical protein
MADPRAARQGIGAGGVRVPFTEFRTSFTSPEGFSRTDIFFGRVANVDMVNWTVDIFSQFDQLRLLDIPVMSPYQHSSRGDGIYVMPEVGSKCAVCWPSDSSPPFVIGFIMPHEVNTLAANDEATSGTGDRADRNQAPSAANFGGGRPRAKPGDITMRGRDGNQVVLHRGGVLQIGANELSQRMYIPLGNLMMDFAENYAMHNAGGSINWGIQEGEGVEGNPTQQVQCYRVFANDKHADIRIVMGKVRQPVVDKESQMVTDLEQLEIAKDDPVVYELTLSRGGFKAESGTFANGTEANVKLRFFFDRAGGTAVRADGSILVRCKKKFRLRVEDDVDLYTKGGFFVDAEGDARLQAGGTLSLTGSSTILQGGEKPVAREGDQVLVPLPPNLAIMTPSGPAPIPPGTNAATGTILQGNPKVLA